MGPESEFIAFGWLVGCIEIRGDGAVDGECVDVADAGTAGNVLLGVGGAQTEQESRGGCHREVLASEVDGARIGCGGAACLQFTEDIVGRVGERHVGLGDATESCSFSHGEGSLSEERTRIEMKLTFVDFHRSRVVPNARGNHLACAHLLEIRLVGAASVGDSSCKGEAAQCVAAVTHLPGVATTDGRGILEIGDRVSEVATTREFSDAEDTADVGDGGTRSHVECAVRQSRGCVEW